MADFLDGTMVSSLKYSLKVAREGETRKCLWRKCRKEFVTHNVDQMCCSPECADKVYNDED